MWPIVALVALLLLATVVGLSWPRLKKIRRGGEQKKAPSGPCAVIVISDEEVEIPAVAMAAKVFKAARMRIVLAAHTARASKPNQRSLDTPVAKQAAERHDPVWVEVLKKVQNPMPLAKLQGSEVSALFIAGGPRMLADLRHTDLQGAKPSAYCLAVRQLAVDVHRCGGVIGAVGHGVRGLPDMAADIDDAASTGARRHEGSVDSAAEQVARAMVASLPPPPPPVVPDEGQTRKDDEKSK